MASDVCSDSTYAGHHLPCFPEYVPSSEQTTTTSLHQSSYVDSLMTKALIRTASGKEGGRNINLMSQHLDLTIEYHVTKALRPQCDQSTLTLQHHDLFHSTLTSRHPDPTPPTPKPTSCTIGDGEKEKRSLSGTLWQQSTTMKACPFGTHSIAENSPLRQ